MSTCSLVSPRGLCARWTTLTKKIIIFILFIYCHGAKNKQTQRLTDKVFFSLSLSFFFFFFFFARRKATSSMWLWWQGPDLFHFWSPKLRKLLKEIHLQRRKLMIAIKPLARPTECPKSHNGRRRLQVLVYDILPSRKVPESDARSVWATRQEAIGTVSSGCSA